MKSGKLNVEAAEAMREASEEAEAQFSGVNLDSQAAALNRISAGISSVVENSTDCTENFFKL